MLVEEGTKGLRDEGTWGRRDGETEGRGEEGTQGRRDGGTKDQGAEHPHLVDDVVRGLRATLEDHRRSQARRAGWTRRVVPMGLVRIDARLPGGGLPCGAITEILSDEPGVGSMTLALRVGGKKGRRDVGTEGHREEEKKGRRDIGTEGHREEGKKGSRDRKIVVVDVCGDFYPPAVAEHGVSLDRIVVVRTVNEQDAFWVVDQSLRCPGVAVVIAPLRHLDERLSRRLQLAAESSGAIGLVLRPAHPRVKSFAAVQMLVEGAGRRRDEGTKGRRDAETERWCENPFSRPSVAPNSKPVAPATPLRSRYGSTGTVATGTVASGPEFTPIHRGAGRFEDRVAHGFSRGGSDGAEVESPTSKEVGHPSGTHLDAVDEVHLCRITLLKVREGMPAEPLLVDLHHEAGALPVYALPVERSSAKRA